MKILQKYYDLLEKKNGKLKFSYKTCETFVFMGNFLIARG